MDSRTGAHTTSYELVRESTPDMRKKHHKRLPTRVPEADRAENSAASTFAKATRRQQAEALGSSHQRRRDVGVDLDAGETG